MAQGKMVRTVTREGIRVVEAGGHFSGESAPLLMEAYREIRNMGEKKMILRMAPETYFNSESIKILIDILVDARNQQMEVGIAGLSDHFEKIFQMVGIRKLAAFYKTLGGALDSMREK